MPVPGCQLPIGVHDRIIDWKQLVGAAELVESGVGDMHVAIVHEHDVAAAFGNGALRRNRHVARRVGDVNFEIGRRSERD